jgi:hypothetical protein
MERTLKIKKIDCNFVELEPGDLTRYRFLITENPDNNDNYNNENYIGISSHWDGPRFESYTYRKLAIVDFFKEVGEPPIDSEKYQNWANHEVMNHPYLRYVISHSGDCNPYTALAGLICAYIIIK